MASLKHFLKLLFHNREHREAQVIRDVNDQDIEIPPNDAAILVDGRLVLEKTPLLLDKIFIEAQTTGCWLYNICGL